MYVILAHPFIQKLSSLKYASVKMVLMFALKTKGEKSTPSVDPHFSNLLLAIDEVFQTLHHFVDHIDYME
jgi:hypothetical protein